MDISDLYQVDSTEIGRVELLQVRSWSKCKWRECHSIGLSHICARFGIEKLRFILGDGTFLPLLEEEAKGKEYVSMPHLKSVYIQLTHVDGLPCSTLLKHARVRLIHWDVVEVSSLSVAVTAAASLFGEMSGLHKLDKNYSVREIKVTHTDGTRERDIFGFFKHSVETAYFTKILRRNQLAWKKCQDVVLACLTLGRTRKSKLFASLGRDMMRMIVNMVWETRGTKVWIPKKTDSSTE
jgi:hypothetical protein